jgi:hypothetical protein
MAYGFVVQRADRDELPQSGSANPTRRLAVSRTGRRSIRETAERHSGMLYAARR